MLLVTFFLQTPQIVSSKAFPRKPILNCSTTVIMVSLHFEISLKLAFLHCEATLMMVSLNSVAVPMNAF